MISEKYLLFVLAEQGLIYYIKKDEIKAVTKDVKFNSEEFNVSQHMKLIDLNELFEDSYTLQFGFKVTLVQKRELAMLNLNPNDT